MILLQTSTDARIPTPAGATDTQTETPTTETGFAALGLAEPILRAVAAEGYTVPTPIQLRAIPALKTGADLLGIAQTGTGKTAAFLLPMLDRLAADRTLAKPRTCRMLVLAPTRELAAQIADAAKIYGRHLGLKIAVVVGGVSARPQIRDLARGVDILIATPGRLLDHVGSNAVRLTETGVVVLDEADQMLDLGFIPAIRRIMGTLPAQRQTMLFSATMPAPIRALASDFLRAPVEIRVTPAATPVETIDQRAIMVGTADKRSLLATLLAAPDVQRAIVFTRTKHRADRVARHLAAAGIETAAIHGNKSQPQRERALDGFRRGSTRVLVATDIAARGIDVDGITHVVNYELPNVPESYVHRIGRTARAGATGIAIALCAPDERPLLRDIEKLIGRTLPKQDAGGEAIGIDTDAGTSAPAQRPQNRKSAGSNRGPNRDRQQNGQKSNGRKANGKAPNRDRSHDRRKDADASSQSRKPQHANRPDAAHRNQPRRENAAGPAHRHPNGDRPLTRNRHGETLPGDEADNAGLARMLGVQADRAPVNRNRGNRRNRAA